MATSPRTPEPARTPARYRAQASNLRRAGLAVLIAGTVLALGCALGPAWLVRLGLVPAVAAAVVCSLLSWREIVLERRAHAAAMLDVFQRHGAQLSEERRRGAAVLETVTRRLHATETVAGSRAATIARLDGDLHRLRGDVQGLRGANARLTRDLNFRDVTIRELRTTVGERDAEVAALTARLEERDDDGFESVDGLDGVGEATGSGPNGTVHAFPRRTLRGEEPPADRSVDATQRTAARDADFLAAEVGIHMPNYEEDRRLA